MTENNRELKSLVASHVHNELCEYGEAGVPRTLISLGVRAVVGLSVIYALQNIKKRIEGGNVLTSSIIRLFLDLVAEHLYKCGMYSDQTLHKQGMNIAAMYLTDLMWFVTESFTATARPVSLFSPIEHKATANIEMYKLEGRDWPAQHPSQMQDTAPYRWYSGSLNRLIDLLNNPRQRRIYKDLSGGYQ